MIFYGWGKKSKVLRSMPSATCGTCNQETAHVLLKVYSYISIMFIPFIRFGTKYYIVCTNCENGVQITKEEAKRLLNEQAA